MLEDEVLDYPENAAMLDTQVGETRIHPTAIVSEKAVLGKGVRIGPYSVIGPQVVLQRGVLLGSHVVVGGRTTIGEVTRVFPFSTLGTRPQNLKSYEASGELIIGRKNTIREYVNIATGTGKTGKTIVGTGNFLMAYTHLAHDCAIGDNCILANGVNLGGHVDIGDRAYLGGLSAVHQFCRVGELAMISGGALVLQDIPPFCLAAPGARARVIGINHVGLERAGLSRTRTAEIKRMFRFVFQKRIALDIAIDLVERDLPSSLEKRTLLEFLRTTRRGISRPRRPAEFDSEHSSSRDY
jgi:UDP-N-acetylglucosamine acyltransferase